MRKDRRKYNNQTKCYKIDIFGSSEGANHFMYLCSTDMSKTCKEAIERYKKNHHPLTKGLELKANYDRS